MIARHFEQNGIPTVIAGAARDIVEHVGVPRFYFSDFPLGHSAGKPHDKASQRDTLMGALALLTNANRANTTVRSPQRWAEDDRWKSDFMRVDHLSEPDIARLQQQHEQAREVKNR